jgi:uncharacterized membrane protein
MIEPSLPPLTTPPPPPKPARTRLRNYFLTGLVVAGPLAITASLTWWFITLVDGWIKPWVPTVYWPDSYLPFPLPGFGLIIAFFGLTLLGFLTANLVGRTLLDLGENILSRMPVVRSIYRGVKQIFETIFSQSGTAFRKVGLVQFPLEGQWSIVFISSPPLNEIAAVLPGKDDYISVFLPCTPNPTTGFYFFVPRKDVIELAISVDDGAKLVMSAGLIQPEQLQKLRLGGDKDKRDAA